MIATGIHLRQARNARRGFTLIEMIIASAIIGLLMVAVGGSVIVAAKASPRTGSPEDLYNQGVSAVQEIAREVSQAITVSEATASKVVFTVPDRTGDATPETFTYELTNDNRLTRKVNAVAAVDIATQVKGFNLGYVTGVRTSTTTNAATEGPEQVLYGCYETTGTEIVFDTTSAAIQTLRPILPREATSWRITKALLCVKADGLATGSVRLNVYRIDANNVPVGSSLATAAISELLMGSSLAWRTVNFGAMSLSPSEGAAIVVAHGSVSITTGSGTVLLNSGGLMTGGRGVYATDAIADRGTSLFMTTSGPTFTAYADDGLALEVYGRVTATTTTTTQVQTIDAVDIQLLVTGSRSIRTLAVVAPRPAFGSDPPDPPTNIIEDIIGGIGGIIGGLLGGGVVMP
jgi:prepilin-type N-terminal cleavage/methylation domain-containing protein